MRSFRARIEKIESGMMERSGLAQIDFSRFTTEELGEVIDRATRGGLRLKLHREPTEEEIAAVHEADRAYLDSLSPQELVRLTHGLERKRAHRSRMHG